MNTPQPPSWATRLFRSYCNDHLSDAVLGDLTELYERRVSLLGKTRADLLFVWNVLQFVQPFALRKKKSSPQNHYAMFRNYFKIAFRSMSRQKMYTGIKIGGFAIGLATCMIIALYIRHELSYDKYYANGSRTYRLYNHYEGPDGGKWTSFPAPLIGILRNEFPEIEKAGRLIPYKWFNAGSNLMRPEDQTENTYEEGFAYADPEILDILEIPMLYGNRGHALDKPNTIVFSRKMAEKYFPGQDPVGKTIVFNDDTKRPYMIGGVMENFPPTSHLQYEFLITLTGEEFWKDEQGSWCCWNYNPYLRLRADADPVAFEQKLQSIIKNHYGPFLKEGGSASLEDVLKHHKIRTQAIGDIYLDSDGIGDIIPHGDKQYILLFGGIAGFILLLACVNFINLSTAKSANRAKEVGLRKVVGSVRGNLVRQFLTESVLYSLISFFLAVVLVWVALPFFSVFAGKTLTMPWTAWWMFPILIAAALGIGVLAGLYPSFYLSAFKPIDVLKGAVARGSKNSTLRSAMVVFQFTTSIVLIIGTFVIYRQMNFILHTKIGFDKDQVIMIQGANTLGDHREAFKEELLRQSAIASVTSSNYLPVSETNRDQNGFFKEGRSKQDRSIGAQRWNVETDYIKTLGMKIVEGRDFIPRLASDSSSIIVNQAMVKAMGLKPPVVGQRIENWRVYTIIGVVEDFHFETMKEKISPLTMVVGNGGSIVAVKVKPGDMKQTIASIQSTWNKIMPNQPFRYTFMDESYARMYQDVERTGNLFAGFSMLAILVACLGLFALSSFMAEQRKKEVSIRLVLGATVGNIFRLLTRSFVVMVLVSFAIASPLGWYMMTRWLEGYSYKTEITWDVFLIAGSAAVVIALLTVSYQAVKVALGNPATNLRSE
ncbi:ABC transporter permease [Chryseolinea soli]|uniref:ABC transporter permease n=1 Tax=Chryseolinea soli TaxID=2321403 RepID=A0A385SGG5_9BACT|nr:ABC transporter permease [Chryseolinea soli]AYB29962.1 ABC transporter permease [Chryseolinea soli]